MLLYLDLTYPEYVKYKKKYPIRCDKEGYYFEENTPYFLMGEMTTGLPEELETYIC
jgi:hypothetical protein